MYRKFGGLLVIVVILIVAFNPHHLEQIHQIEVYFLEEYLSWERLLPATN
jgi:hypothetical protein